MMWALWSYYPILQLIYVATRPLLLLGSGTRPDPGSGVGSGIRSDPLELLKIGSANTGIAVNCLIYTESHGGRVHDLVQGPVQGRVVDPTLEWL